MERQGNAHRLLRAAGRSRRACIAFAYIDGAHTYEQSMRDFQNVSRHLIGGGFIVFDDSADSSHWGSRLTAQEAAKHPDYELIAKNPNYCVRKKP